MDLQDVMTEIRERVARIEAKIDGYNGLREKIDKAYGIACANKEDIQELKDNNKWLWRTIIGGFIATAISFITRW